MEELLETTRIVGISPIVPVRRVARAIDFYTQILGFRLMERNPELTFARVERDGAQLLLLDLGDSQALQATGRYLSAYVWTADPAALWRELSPRLARLPDGRVTPLFRRADGREEFHVRDPDGLLLFFGAEPRD